jgi:penicillin-binding protein 1A
MRRHVLTAAVLMMTVALGAAAWRAAAFTVSIVAELDRAGTIANIAPRPQATLVFDRAGRPAFSFFVEQRFDVPLSSVSQNMIDALLAVEDRRFFSHYGIDPIRIAGAAWRNLRAGRIVEGGSTITQQLARAAQLSPVRTYDRKIREILLAGRLEERYSKARILEEYLNTVYFGEGYYGVEAASRGYFGKTAGNLNVHEAALLAALVRSPSNDAPCVAPRRALARRNLVLRLMRSQGRITEDELRVALAARIPDASHQDSTALASASGTGMYFQEEVRRQLVAMFGSERVLRGGLRVYSTLDPGLQREAERAVTSRIEQIAKGRRAARDLQGSLVSMDPETGDVLALVGGRDFHASSFNRATQARRQAGSAFKPIIYAAALERGYAPGTLLRDLDAPILDSNPTGAWLPGGEHEASEYTLRRALKVSSNRAAAQLLQQVGVSTAVYYAQRLGIDSDLPLVPSLALGTGEVTLLELTAAYSAFANNGLVAAPRLITRVEDQDGKTIWFAEERRTQAISPTTAYLMSSMLSDVVSSGTAAAVRSAGFSLPAAGKTGTTDDYADAWFIGYTRRLLTGVWFGLDRPAPIMRGGFGGVVAVPAWARFMREATKGAKAEWYRAPAGVEKVAICRLTGARATEACRHAHAVPASAPALVAAAFPVDQPAASDPLEPPVYEDLFPAGSVPTEVCTLHGAPASPSTDSTTPMVDAALRSTTVSAAPVIATAAGTAVRTGTRLFVEKVAGEDGLVRYIVKQK